MRQSVGGRGIGVQISGNDNSVVLYADTAELHLLRKHLRRAPPKKTELDLLRVDLRATTLVGRDADTAALTAWLADSRQVSLRCITGRAGMGKTRLGIELCDTAAQNGWTAGLADHAKFPAFVAQAAIWRWSTPTLVVIDYAAALARDLRLWLESLARPETQQNCPKLRVLLLERHADRDVGWWADLLRPTSFSDPAPDELADPKWPVALPSLNAVEDRRALLAETMRLAADIAGLVPAPQPPALGANAPFDQKLADDTIDNEPLYLMMAGAEAVRSGAPAALALNQLDLAHRAASREQARLAHLADQWGVPGKLVAHLAACVTLQGGCSAEDALTLVEEERLAMNYPATGPASDLVNRLAEALPGALGIDAIRPDLIGEAFLLLVLRDHARFPTTQSAIVTRAWQRSGARVAATLVRTAQDHARGDATHPSVVWLGQLAEQIQDYSALQALAAELPWDTLALRELAATVETRIGKAMAARAKDVPQWSNALAGQLTTLASRLSRLGRREAGLAAVEEAVAIRRELAVQHPDAFRPELALSLNTLANMLSDLGRREAALSAAEEAVSLYYELAAQRPDEFRRYVAMSLNNLANRLSNLGRREAALSAVQEAASLYREPGAQRPGAFRSELATSLNNLAIMLSDLGRREAALAAAEETAALFRELAAQRPDAFRPDLAGSLNNLANRLGDLGRRKAALAAAEEAASLYRELVAQRPDAFQSNLAMSLNSLAAMLSHLGRPEAALSAAEEAASLYRELAVHRPDAFRPDLAMSLSNLANRLSDLDRREAAFAAAEEAASIYRELAAQRADAFKPDLAASLNNLAIMLKNLGRREAALAAAEEAIATRRELVAQHPDAFGPDLAASLGVRANCLEALERVNDALASNAEAIEWLSPAFAQHPAAFAHWMVPMIQQYRERCERLGKVPDTALLASAETVLEGLDREGKQA